MIPNKLLHALSFAAHKHQDQRRKNAEASPYINHPIEVANILANIGGVKDEAILVAAILHDTIEDTQTSVEELEDQFGKEVAGLVQELTDDKSLPGEERKRLQIEHAAGSSLKARHLKLADKISNVSDLSRCPPVTWTPARLEEYVVWSERVVAGCRGVNPELESAFDATVQRARQVLKM
jgi:guanosine-3',5'-bis(diphosphate) 3'-pyrophosphohydrolase